MANSVLSFAIGSEELKKIHILSKDEESIPFKFGCATKKFNKKQLKFLSNWYKNPEDIPKNFSVWFEEYAWDNFQYIVNEDGSVSELFKKD